METLYLTKDAKLAREGSTLLVRIPDTPKRRIPVSGLRHVVVTGEAGLTTRLLNLFGKSGVRVTVLDWYGNVSGTFEPVRSPAAGRVRLAQAEHALDPEKAMFLARSFVEGALGNMIVNLRYRSYRGNTEVDSFIDKIKKIRKDLSRAKSINELMGFEGSAKGWYYMAWPIIDTRLEFGPRKRRPPNNRINCLISWFNGLAYTMTRNEIAKTHLDDSISFLHSPREARHSLALDLSEIFKPAICDTLIFETVLRSRLREDWFHQENGVCRLSQAGRQATLQAWVSKTETRANGKNSMRSSIFEQAFALERHMLSLAPYRPWLRKV